MMVCITQEHGDTDTSDTGRLIVWETLTQTVVLTTQSSVGFVTNTMNMMM